MTQEEAGEPIRISKSKLSRIEQGHLPGYNDYLALLDRYGVLVSDYPAYVRTFDEAKEPGWWPRNPPRDYGFVDVEASACAKCEYQIAVVPGLFQTATYARRVYERSGVRWSADQVTQQVEVRMRRQRRLVDDCDFRVHAIMDEAVLHRPSCDREQLERFIERATLPNVTVQIVPFSADGHSGLQGGFVILDFPDPEEPGLLYLEGGFGSLHLESAKELTNARSQFKQLSRVALDESASVELLKQLAVGLHGTL